MCDVWRWTLWRSYLVDIKSQVMRISLIVGNKIQRKTKLFLTIVNKCSKRERNSSFLIKFWEKTVGTFLILIDLLALHIYEFPSFFFYHKICKTACICWHEKSLLIIMQKKIINLSEEHMYIKLIMKGKKIHKTTYKIQKHTYILVKIT